MKTKHRKGTKESKEEQFLVEMNKQEYKCK
jgi:hypothetical protein